MLVGRQITKPKREPSAVEFHAIIGDEEEQEIVDDKLQTIGISFPATNTNCTNVDSKTNAERTLRNAAEQAEEKHKKSPKTLTNPSIMLAASNRVLLIPGER
jgi:hypothetical protein